MENKCNCNECINWEDCEIKIILHNSRREQFKIKKGDKIAQILLKEHKTWFFGIENNNERIGGFGSTDIK